MCKFLCLIFIVLLCQPLSVALAQQQTSAEPELKLGVFPRRSANITEKMFQPMAAALTRALDRKVVLETTYDFASFWENVAEKRYDIVHYNQYHYIKSHRDYGYRVIARNVEFGHKEIAGAIVVRKDSGIDTLQDLKGKKIVFGGGHKAMMAYIAPTYLLRQAGLKSGDYFEKFALNPPKAVIATYYRQAAASGAGNYLLDLPIVKNDIDTDEMKYLAISRKMTNLPWAVSQSLPEELVTKIQTVLVELFDTAEGKKVLKSARITKILPANDSEFDLHREMTKVVLGEEL